ncbi:glycosyltransferase family 2 protein [Pontixanthobacter gangjinensis]|uniref:Glycosyltransferase n=1 Tax=Pontixanthobacter gangjinensis TaxID=1028742 RepID=A0A6I4SQ61_9SPHN|nr:glycosyltransferase family 2 protein [Pontixanthobacter gangjinensis]MXO57498.1 glycosyltransferase [Pontixanthobacter gangjinensis]
MTKLIVQIPCFNEAEDLPATLAAIPRRIEGIDTVEILVIDDGSHDGTSDVARRWGVHHIIRHRRNRGLASAFRSGIRAALEAGADIIVNTDADGQYEGADIAALVGPVIAGNADIVIGDRGVGNNEYFGPLKRLLQRLGSTVVRRLSRTEITDAVSGFRAMTRAAAQQINITTDFSYTTDMLIQSGRKRFAIKSVPIRTNKTLRPSRLFSSVPRFIINTGITIARAYTTHNPLRVFVGGGALIALIGLAPILRFGWFYLSGDGDGHIQSLVIGGALLVLGTLVAIMGVLADLVAANRKLIETNLYEIRQLRDELKLRPEAQKSGEDSVPLRQVKSARN